MKLRGLTNQVWVKPRTDLEELGGTMAGLTFDEDGRPLAKAVHAEVLSVGPGCEREGNTLPIEKGDIVLINLPKIGPPTIVDGVAWTPINFADVLAVRRSPNDERKRRWEPLLDIVMLEVTEDVASVISKRIIVPRSVLSGGSAPEGSRSPIRSAFRRVVAKGPGISVRKVRCDCGRRSQQFQRCDGIEPGNLVVINPSWAVPFRQLGVSYEFVQYDEIRGVIEE